MVIKKAPNKTKISLHFKDINNMFCDKQNIEKKFNFELQPNVNIINSIIFAL